MATLTVQSITRTGLNPTYAAASALGYQVANNGRVFLHVKNGSASAHTVTIESQVSTPPPGTSVSDVAVSVPAGAERMIGPFPPNAFNDADKYMQITYSAVTSLTVAAIS